MAKPRSHHAPVNPPAPPAARNAAHTEGALHTTYPADRPQYFAMQFCRTLSDRRAAQEIGTSGFALLMLIVSTEDATGFKKPVRFWRDDLASRLGITPGTLDRVRKKCIAAGWLQYVQNARSKFQAGSYWVTIPEEAEQPETKTETKTLFSECHAEPSIQPRITPSPTPANGTTVQNRSARQRATPCAPARNPLRASAHHSSLTYFPNTSSHTPPTPEAGDRVCAKPRAEASPPKPPDPPRQPTLFDAIAEVSGSDPVLNRRRIGGLAKTLAAAAYEPKHIYDFAKQFHDLCGWSPEVRALHPRPSLRVIETHIGKIRLDPSTVPKPPPAARARSGREAKDDLARRLAAMNFGPSSSKPKLEVA